MFLSKFYVEEFISLEVDKWHVQFTIIKWAGGWGAE